MPGVLQRKTVGKRLSDPQICLKKPEYWPAKTYAIFKKTACFLSGGMVEYKTVVSERRENPVNTET